MLERLGNVLYWLGCGLAGLLLIGGLLVVMTAFDLSRPFEMGFAPKQSAPKLLSDEEFGIKPPLGGSSAPAGKDDWITAPRTTPYYDTYKVWYKVWPGLAICCLALIPWLIGRACRYILSGK